MAAGRSGRCSGGGYDSHDFKLGLQTKLLLADMGVGSLQGTILFVNLGLRKEQLLEELMDMTLFSVFHFGSK